MHMHREGTRQRNTDEEPRLASTRGTYSVSEPFPKREDNSEDTHGQDFGGGRRPNAISWVKGDAAK